MATRTEALDHNALAAAFNGDFRTGGYLREQEICQSGVICGAACSYAYAGGNPEHLSLTESVAQGSDAAGVDCTCP